MLRNVLISLACRSGYEKCLAQTASLYRNWLDKGVKVDANIRSYVYKYGMTASTDDTDWQRVWDMYQVEKDAAEKSKLMAALTSTTSEPMLLTFGIRWSNGLDSTIGVWEIMSNQLLVALERSHVWLRCKTFLTKNPTLAPVHPPVLVLLNRCETTFCSPARTVRWWRMCSANEIKMQIHGWIGGYPKRCDHRNINWNLTSISSKKSFSVLSRFL